MTDLATLAMPEREAWSARPGVRRPNGAGAEATGGGREHVALVPDGSTLEAGFAWARRALAANGGLVRVIGRDATDPSRWPAWAYDEPRFVVTEIDAYLPLDRTALARGVVEAGRRWIGEVFAGALDDLDPVSALWASASNRLLLRPLEARALAWGVARHHAADVIHVTAAGWWGIATLRSLAAPHGGEVTVATRGKSTVVRHGLRRAWAVALPLCAGVATLGAAALRVWERLRDRRVLAELGRLRDGEAGAGVPATHIVHWVGVPGDGPGRAGHAVEAAASLQMPVGLVLQGALGPAASALLAGRGPLGSLAGRVVALDQCVAVEDTRAFAAQAAAWISSVLRVSARLGRAGPVLRLDDLDIDLPRLLGPLVRLVTMDLLRAREAAVAARSFAERRTPPGASVFWAHASLAAMATADLVVRDAGARAFEVVHGAFPDGVSMMTYAHSNAIRLAWSRLEAASIAPVVRHQRCFGGWLPRPPARRSGRPSDGRPRVLLLTNYGHGFGTQIDERPSLEVYQRTCLQALSAAVKAWPGPVELRWRPHPHDEPKSIRRACEAHPLPGFELSHGLRSLEDDLGWCDALVSAWSSSVLDALWHPIAVFLHEIPLYEPAFCWEAFEPERRFHGAADLVPRLCDWLEQWSRADPARLEPETRSRARVFGSSGELPTLAHLLSEVLPILDREAKPSGPAARRTPARPS